MSYLGKLASAFLTLVAGFLLGIVLLEMLFQVNPAPLFRGMALPAPLDAPLASRTYAVHNTDGDAFLWRPDLVAPPDEQLHIYTVDYQTDLFGFRNSNSFLRYADVVVLGRSYSQGAQVPQAWPEILSTLTGWEVRNLSQPGGDLANKTDLYRKYGRDYHSRWLILEVAPKIDLLAESGGRSLLVSKMGTPLAQNLIKNYFNLEPAESGRYIFPLPIQLPGREYPLTCCLHYMEYYSLSAEQISASNRWQLYKDRLLALGSQVKEQGACLAIFIVPSKVEIYFKLAEKPEQLDPIMIGHPVYRLQENGELRIVDDPLTTPTVLGNLNAGSDLVKQLAWQESWIVIDPTDLLQKAVIAGQDPFLEYDSHWNSLGHQLIAQRAEEVLSSQECAP